ncbi:fluoride efflux transporter CrcB [Sediminicurvatus halobius]|uniref:Fluoride-specific ion channel FluC n=1 Tax=Sediminicurvatus halobius TaxID=2182432 RepID=A0A2U2MXW6_9GAMM|nr:fluoride efflux transporter CrcB [Spiribacter halobius]PWG61623.1 fluoride efflux transporter CrcB [Spiribacter halobius]UEX77300.1 fluoride efflux transporter CrcB [Spiribacter halobius]
MNEWLAVAGGGALGASARYGVYLLVAHTVGVGFPWATPLVNIAGSLAMGVLVELTALLWLPAPWLRDFLAVGFLGAFTTFSTFSLDVVTLWERDRVAATVAYVLASGVLSVLACVGGMVATRRLLGP